MKKNNSGKLILGVALILFGLLLLEDTIGFDFFDQIFPLLLIGLGVAHMIRRRNKDINSSTGFHSNTFDKKNYDFETKAKNFESKIDEKVNAFESKIDDFEKKIHKTFSGTSNGKVKYEKAFGDLFVYCKNVNVENVVVSSAFGDIELQMREAEFVEGLNRLVISNFIGEVNIYLPKNLPIFVNCSNFIGDIEAVGKRSTGFGNKVESQSTDYDTATCKLYIACNSFIGDIHIIAV